MLIRVLESFENVFSDFFFFFLPLRMMCFCLFVVCLLAGWLDDWYFFFFFFAFNLSFCIYHYACLLLYEIGIVRPSYPFL